MSWKKILLEGDQYTHPTSNGFKHIPADGGAGKFLGWSGAQGEASWQDPPSSSTWNVNNGQGTKQWTTSHEDAIRFAEGSNISIAFDTTNKYITFSATDTNTDTKWTGTSVGLVAATGRTSLGLGTMATAATSSYAALAGATFTGIVKIDEGTARLANRVLEINEGTTASLGHVNYDTVLIQADDAATIRFNDAGNANGQGAICQDNDYMRISTKSNLYFATGFDNGDYGYNGGTTALTIN